MTLATLYNFICKVQKAVKYLSVRELLENIVFSFEFFPWCDRSQLCDLFLFSFCNAFDRLSKIREKRKDYCFVFFSSIKEERPISVQITTSSVPLAYKNRQNEIRNAPPPTQKTPKVRKKKQVAVGTTFSLVFFEVVFSCFDLVPLSCCHSVSCSSLERSLRNAFIVFSFQ